MVIVWRLKGNIVRTHNVHGLQHTYMSSSYRSNRLGLSYWDPYVVRRGSCVELYYCNMVEWFWWDSSLILTTNWFTSELWYGWFGHLACKNRRRNDVLCVEWDIKPYTLTHSQQVIVIFICTCLKVPLSDRHLQYWNSSVSKCHCYLCDCKLWTGNIFGSRIVS